MEVTLLALAMALAAACGPLALAADDCAREARVWAVAVEASDVAWIVVPVPEAA